MEELAEAGRKSRLTRHAVVAGVLVVLVFLVAQAVKTPGTTSKGEGYIARVVSGTAVKQTVTFPLTPKEGDVEHESSHIFDVVATIPGVGTGRIILQGPRLEVGYDPSATSEDAIRRALVAAGYVPAQAGE